jgi:hypothetical protein
MDVQPDGYVSVLVDSPATSSDLVQPQDDGSARLPIEASESPTSVLDRSKHRLGYNEDEPCCTEVGAVKESASSTLSQSRYN